MRTLHPPYVAPTEVTPDIYLVQIPIPIPLKYVNCYLFRGPSGWTLVDTGFHDELAEAAWPRALADLGIRTQDINRILVTHYHPDHFGAAGWLQQLTGAPAYMHEVELQQVELFWGQGMESQAEALKALFSSEGMPEEVAEEIAAHHHLQWERVQPEPELTPIPTGEQFALGAEKYEVLWTPGHSDGLAVFWNAASGLLVANDMLLNKITPNVSLWPNGRPNPLQDFIASLTRLEGLGAKLALPGHRTLITDVAGRALEIKHHHDERLDLMEAACTGSKGATAWEVCQQIFSPDTLTIHQVRFAMSETLAHLVYLEQAGNLRKEGDRYIRV